MIKPNVKTMWPVTVIAALFLLASAGMYSCQKGKAPESNNETPVAVTPQPTDRLYSVANVFYTEDGSRAEVWFYESPMVFEFNADAPNAAATFATLKSAKENNVPVNVRLSVITGNRVDVAYPSTSEQRAVFSAAAAKRETAVSVPAPEEISQGRVALVGVVPNVATLNTIFNKVRDQCCKLPGPYIYGQCVPFQFVADGCYARAHKMRQIIENFYGYTSYKVFNYACNGAGTLSVKATLWGNNCCVKWWYHVASYVYVQSGSSQVAYLLDPAMFTGPVSIGTWVAAQKNTTCGYNGSAQGQVYYTSLAYAPSSLNTATCTLTPFGDNTYTAANATCASYAPKQGCTF